MKKSEKAIINFIEEPKQELKISKSLVSFLLTEDQEKQIVGGGSSCTGAYCSGGFDVTACEVKEISCTILVGPWGSCNPYHYCNITYSKDGENG